MGRLAAAALAFAMKAFKTPRAGATVRVTVAIRQPLGFGVGEDGEELRFELDIKRRLRIIVHNGSDGTYIGHTESGLPNTSAPVMTRLRKRAVERARSVSLGVWCPLPLLVTLRANSAR